MQAELTLTSFDQMGSLYEKTEGGGFYVGEMCPGVELERARVSKGPWVSAQRAMEDLVKEQLEEVKLNGENIRGERIKQGLEGDVAGFERLYSAVLYLVSRVRLLGLKKDRFSISHPDLTMNNILVGYDDPTHVVGIIDWEGTRIKPWVSRMVIYK